MAGKSYPQQLHDRGFACGVAVACSTIFSSHGASVEVREVLIATGLTTRRKMKYRGVDSYDLDILRPVFAEIRQHELNRRR